MRDRGDASVRSVDHNEVVPPDTVISLWEEDDSGRDDHLGSFELHVTDDADLTEARDPIRFRYDRDGATATYELTYRVTASCE